MQRSGQQAIVPGVGTTLCEEEIGESVEGKAMGIRKQLEKYPTVRNLIWKVNERTLMEVHCKQSRKKASGVDTVDKYSYDRNVGEYMRMRKFSYRPQPVRRTYLSKANGTLRSLGISTYE